MPHLAGASLEAPVFLGPSFFDMTEQHQGALCDIRGSVLVFYILKKRRGVRIFKMKRNSSHITFGTLVCFAKRGCLTFWLVVFRRQIEHADVFGATVYLL